MPMLWLMEFLASLTPAYVGFSLLVSSLSTAGFRSWISLEVSSLSVDDPGYPFQFLWLVVLLLFSLNDFPVIVSFVLIISSTWLHIFFGHASFRCPISRWNLYLKETFSSSSCWTIWSLHTPKWSCLVDLCLGPVLHKLCYRWKYPYPPDWKPIS